MCSAGPVGLMREVQLWTHIHIAIKTIFRRRKCMLFG